MLSEVCPSCCNYNLCKRFSDVACDASNNHRFYKNFNVYVAERENVSCEKE